MGRSRSWARDRRFPLGILPDAEYQQVDVDLRPGDVAVVYSDGVTDSRNPAEDLYDTRKTAVSGSASGARAAPKRSARRSFRNP